MPRIKGSGDKAITQLEDGTFLVRVSFFDPATGRRHDKRRVRDEHGRPLLKRTAAEKELRRLIREAEENDGRGILHERKTFADLAKVYEDRHAKAPEYIGDRKVAGLRSFRTVQQHLNMLKEHFRERHLRTFTAATLEDFRMVRLNTPVSGICGRCGGVATLKIQKLGDRRWLAHVSYFDSGKKRRRHIRRYAATRAEAEKIQREIIAKQPERSDCAACGGSGRVQRQRAIASVNRELALLRRMLGIAVRLGWLSQNPFATADKLISIADEKKRQRILTVEEERTLLSCARGTKERDTLRAILIAALDTGMRQGEILKLRWRDVDMQSGTVHVVAFNTKTAQARSVRMTPRLTKELQRLEKDAAPDDLVFGVKTNVKRSFASVRREAELEGVRFHDLRHTAASRLVAGHLPLAEVGRILGHTQPQTTYRYANVDGDALARAAAILEAFNNATEQSAGTL